MGRKLSTEQSCIYSDAPAVWIWDILCFANCSLKKPPKKMNFHLMCEGRAARQPEWESLCWGCSPLTKSPAIQSLYVSYWTWTESVKYSVLLQRVKIILQAVAQWPVAGVKDIYRSDPSCDPMLWLLTTKPRVWADIMTVDHADPRHVARPICKEMFPNITNLGGVP